MGVGKFAVKDALPTPMPENLSTEDDRLRRENHKLLDTNESYEFASTFSLLEQSHQLDYDPLHW